MRGKLGLVVGIGVGYVLGARAGKERYEQIKAKTNELWQTPVVQTQVEKAKTLATSSALLIPRAAGNGLLKVAKAALGGSGDASERGARAAEAAKDAAKDVEEATATVKDDVKKAGN